MKMVNGIMAILFILMRSKSLIFIILLNNYSTMKEATIGQFTGAVDCDGIGIYEYDFVIFVGGRKIPKIVIRDKHRSEFRLLSCNEEGFCAGFPYSLDYVMSLNNFKIIVNIFDNPELIPKEIYKCIMDKIKKVSEEMIE